MCKYLAEHSEKTLLSDKQWSRIDGELCRVMEFTPMMGCSVENGMVIDKLKGATPYASVTLECETLKEKTTGYITHKVDFKNLWEVFNNRTISTQSEEVLLYWTKKHYSNVISKILSFSMPKVIVSVCPRGTYERSYGVKLVPGDEAMVVVCILMPRFYRKPDVIK